MANIIIHSDERREQQNEALRDYGIDPRRASSLQREMADCIAQKTNEAYSEAGKVGTL
jgi:hypothetical protein